MRREAQPAFVIDKLIRESDLSEWLQEYAGTNQQADPARTCVALDGRRTFGYYPLTTGSVHKHESPQRIASGPANHPNDELSG